jgi:hypothetical protein
MAPARDRGCVVILIAVNEWLGPGRRMTPEQSERTLVKERLVSFASTQTLAAAILHLRGYEDAYNAVYPLAVNFTVLSVATIDDLTAEHLDAARIEVLDLMPCNVEQLQRRRGS